MKPIFSVVVPIYNKEKYLKKCIESVLNQTYDNYELVLVNDGSSDNCPKMCDDYAKKHKNIKVVHKKNGGLVSARNAGLEVATGEYIFNLDADDWLKEDSLEIVYNKAIKEHHPDMIISNMTKVFEDRIEEIPCLVDEGYFDKEKLEKEIYPYMMYDKRKHFYTGLVFPSSGGKIIKANLLKKHFCKNEKIRMGEDNAYLFECVYYANDAYFINDHLYQYLQIDTFMSKSYDSTRFDNNRLLIDYIYENLGGKEDYLDFQLNAFKTYWLIMAIFHDAKCKRPLFKSYKHIKSKIKETSALKGIEIGKLPFFAKVFVILSRMHLYFTVILLSRFISKFRK